MKLCQPTATSSAALEASRLRQFSSPHRKVDCRLSQQQLVVNADRVISVASCLGTSAPLLHEAAVSGSSYLTISLGSQAPQVELSLP